MSDEIAYLRARYVEEEGLAKRAAFGWGAYWTADGEGDLSTLAAPPSAFSPASMPVDTVLAHAARDGTRARRVGQQIVRARGSARRKRCGVGARARIRV